MELYIYEDYRRMYPQLDGSELTDRLIADSLADMDIDFVSIMRTEKGKPYVVGRDDIHLSVSHSGNILVCLIGDEPLGVDIQEERRVKSKEIARRFFTEDESEYVENKGSDGFFMLWTRKEAYAKLTGLGLEEIMKGSPVLGRSDLTFIDFQLEKGLYCSCCTMNEEHGDEESGDEDDI